MKSVLIIQCLQNDFVKPIGKYESIPNLLHIGYQEAKRLMGDDPENGPISSIINWAYKRAKDELCIINIRDWHNENDDLQKHHLQVFGNHCLQNSEGAKFCFNQQSDKRAYTVNASGLNDFYDTNLEIILQDTIKQGHNRIGIIGVWTEAKIHYLAYEISTRYPDVEIAICSALTASSSTASHFAALEQIEKILSVKVIHSLGAFISFLGGEKSDLEALIKVDNKFPEVIVDGEAKISDTDDKIIRYLYRSSKKVTLKVLAGGYSGNLVFSASSIDMNNHEEVPHVLKIGEQSSVGQERMYFERIEQVLGNNAPRIVDFVDLNERGGIKYRYASMGKESSTTIQKKIMSGSSLDDVFTYFDIVFQEQLGRFYKAATSEKVNLFDYYNFNSIAAERRLVAIEKVYGKSANDELLELPTGEKYPNPYYFYKRDIDLIKDKATRSTYMSFVHGDLNGANIIIDSNDNVWLIDFFHTERGHVLKDLIKMENDLLYIFTPLESNEDLQEALEISKVLFDVEDLAKPLPTIDKLNIKKPALIRTYEILSKLRSYYPQLLHSDRNPLQTFVGQLRFSMHTLSFFESNEYHKKWALYNSGHFGKIISEQILRSEKLRVDWLLSDKAESKSIGMTLLPGRKDYDRNLRDDIQQIKNKNIEIVIPLITFDEMHEYGVDDLIKEYKIAGLEVYHLPIMDQYICSTEQMVNLIAFIEEKVKNGKKILLHCVGGLGRTGLVAATYLKHLGIDSKTAISEVRKSRSQRAIESKIQETFIYDY